MATIILSIKKGRLELLREGLDFGGGRRPSRRAPIRGLADPGRCEEVDIRGCEEGGGVCGAGGGVVNKYLTVARAVKWAA